MTTLTSIRAALEDALKTITIANGYSLDISSSHIYNCWDSRIVSKTTDTDYPKLFVLTEGGTTSPQAAGRTEKEIQFSLILVLKFLNQVGETPVRTRIESAIDDIEKCLDTNRHLGNLVENMEITDYSTDSGFSYPEAIAVFTVKTLHYEERLG